MGRLKDQTSMRLFRQLRSLRKKPYWGNHFVAKGYCVDTVGLGADLYLIIAISAFDRSVKHFPE
jgi:putative transposase